MTTILRRPREAATEPTRPPSEQPPPDRRARPPGRTASGIRAVGAGFLRTLEEHWATMMLWRL